MSVCELRHDAFVYSSDGQFVEQMVPFLVAGLAEGAAALAVTTREKCNMLGEALGPASSRVSFIHNDAWYLRPSTAIAGYHTALQKLARAGAPSVRVTGEVSFGSERERWSEWIAYEGIANHTFADLPAWIVCPYDERVLPEEVVESAWRTHPHVLGDSWQANSRYDDPENVVRDFAPERDPGLDLRRLRAPADPPAFRELLRHQMAGAGVPEQKLRDMLVAANEIFLNACRHGGGVRLLRAGRVADRFVCEITDRGPGLEDQLAGYLPPWRQPQGGLWLARHLTWRVDLLSSEEGLKVRVWV